MDCGIGQVGTDIVFRETQGAWAALVHVDLKKEMDEVLKRPADMVTAPAFYANDEKISNYTYIS